MLFIWLYTFKESPSKLKSLIWMVAVQWLFQWRSNDNSKSLSVLLGATYASCCVLTLRGCIICLWIPEPAHDLSFKTCPTFFASITRTDLHSCLPWSGLTLTGWAVLQSWPLLSTQVWLGRFGNWRKISIFSQYSPLNLPKYPSGRLFYWRQMTPIQFKLYIPDY